MFRPRVPIWQQWVLPYPDQLCAIWWVRHLKYFHFKYFIKMPFGGQLTSFHSNDCHDEMIVVMVAMLMMVLPVLVMVVILIRSWHILWFPTLHISDSSDSDYSHIYGRLPIPTRGVRKFPTKPLFLRYFYLSRKYKYKSLLLNRVAKCHRYGKYICVNIAPNLCIFLGGKIISPTLQIQVQIFVFNRLIAMEIALPSRNIYLVCNKFPQCEDNLLQNKFSDCATHVRGCTGGCKI